MHFCNTEDTEWTYILTKLRRTVAKGSEMCCSHSSNVLGLNSFTSVLAQIHNTKSHGVRLGIQGGHHVCPVHNQENGGHAWLQSKYIQECISWTKYYFSMILALPFYGEYHSGNIAIWCTVFTFLSPRMYKDLARGMLFVVRFTSDAHVSSDLYQV